MSQSPQLSRRERALTILAGIAGAAATYGLAELLFHIGGVRL